MWLPITIFVLLTVFPNIAFDSGSYMLVFKAGYLYSL